MYNLVKAVRDEWPVATSARWAIVLAVAIGLTAGYGWAKLSDSDTIAALRERLALYQDRLQGASPDDAAKRISDLQRDLESLKRRIAQRHVTPPQREAVTATLNNSTGYVSVLSVPGCDECEEYAEELRSSIRAVAGWSADGSPALIGPGAELRGVRIGVKDLNSKSPTAVNLEKALKNAGIDFEWWDDANLLPGQVRLLVARRTLG